MPSAYFKSPTYINVYSPWFHSREFNQVSSITAPASANWGAANSGQYYPFSLPFPYPVKRLFWANGATGAASADIGIFTYDGTTLYTATPTAQSGTSNIQYVTPASTIMLEAGARYYLGLWFSGTTGLFYGVIPGTGTAPRMAGQLAQLSISGGLPTAAATFGTAASGGFGLCGFTKTAS